MKEKGDCLRKIALIIPNLGPGGAERALSRLSNVLNIDEHEIFVVIFNEVENSYKVCGEVINISVPSSNNKLMKMINIFKRTYKLKKIKDQYQFDVAISFLEGANFVNIFSRKKEKVIVSVRNYKSLERNSFYEKAQNILIKYLYKRADEIVAVSKLIKQDLVKNYKIKNEKIKVIYNSYDTNEITNQANGEIPVDYIDLFKEGKVITTVGRLTYQKGHWNLIKAFSIFLKKHNEYKLLIVGEGELEKDLKKLVLELKIQNNVIFTGYVSNPFPIIKESKIYVLSSLFEGFPNALIEAMCCSKPVISTDCKSGPQEILIEKYYPNYKIRNIEYEDYGVLVPTFDGKLDFTKTIEENHFMLSDAMEKLINDPKRLNHYEYKSFERAEKFSNQASYENWMKVIN